jgi:hypothetical protein
MILSQVFNIIMQESSYTLAFLSMIINTLFLIVILTKLEIIKISILEKYNHIDCRWSELPDIIGGVHNDGVEGVIYYFCKNDLTNYKKSDVSNIRKHYKIPLLKCN